MTSPIKSKLRAKGAQGSHRRTHAAYKKALTRAQKLLRASDAVLARARDDKEWKTKRERRELYRKVERALTQAMLTLESKGSASARAEERDDKKMASRKQERFSSYLESELQRLGRFLDAMAG